MTSPQYYYHLANSSPSDPYGSSMNNNGSNRLYCYEGTSSELCTSTKTSWEFQSPYACCSHRSISFLRTGEHSVMVQSPMMMGRGSESFHHRSIPVPSPPTNGLVMLKDDMSDGSRNSTGSSSGGSHRSQDSGFLDSGEPKKRRDTNKNLTGISIPMPSPIPSCGNMNVTYDVVNANQSCSNCIYQEILSQQGNGSLYTSVGSPICSSTPKRSSSSRLGMQKIDNFESLNKNVNKSENINNNNNSSSSSTKKDGSRKEGSKSSLKQNSSRSLDLTNSRNAVEEHNKNVVLMRGPMPLPLPPEEFRNLPTPPPNFRDDENETYSSPKPKWSDLPRGYKRVSTKDLITSCRVEDKEVDMIVVKSHFENDSMRLWLHELRMQTENECAYILQTKSILVESSSATKRAGEEDEEEKKEDGDQTGKAVVQAIHAIQAPLMSIKNVESMANVVSAEFAKICKNIEFGFLPKVPKLVISLIESVESFLYTFQSTSSFPNLQKLEHKLARGCRRLNRSAHCMIEQSPKEREAKSLYSIIEPETTKKGEEYSAAVNETVGGIVNVGNLFSQVVDLRLTRDLSLILDVVEGGGVPAKVALKNLTQILLDGGNHLCRIASEIRTVRGLLGVILDSKDDDHLQILALRCLATILCVGEAVKDFDRASGFVIVADFIYETCHSFELKIEAVSVLTQATDPWIDLEASLSTLSSNLEKILVALTNLVPACKSSEESLLLVVAAISNLTFLEVSSVHILQRYNTLAYIIDTIEGSQYNYSVFVLDHVATILANMAGAESCRDCIIKVGGVRALLKFLQRRPNPSHETAPEIMACERVQQKSTIAISRLCGVEGVAQLIFERGGVHRLIQLSRNEKERNYSDGVLIAALATLRKLVGICGAQAVQGLQADDLIQPRLLDSFLLYSSRQESYV